MTCRECRFVSFCSQCTNCVTNFECSKYKYIGPEPEPQNVSSQCRVRTLASRTSINLLLFWQATRFKYFPSRKIPLDPRYSPVQKFWPGLFVRPRQMFKSLSEIEGWYDYYYTLASNFQIKDEIDKESLVCLPESKMFDWPALEFCYLTSTEELSFILTIFAALEKALDNNNLGLFQRTELEVHIVDATQAILERLFESEVILHLIPSLKTMTWVFVGPYISRPTAMMGQMPDSPEVCDACTNKSRSITNYVHRDEYHSYLKNMKERLVPDMAVVFNPIFSTKADTDETVIHLINANFCTVFTCDTEYMMKETTHLAKLGAEFMVEPEKNLWQSKRPLLIPRRTEEYSITYENEYWWIVRGRGCIDNSAKRKKIGN